MDGPRACRASEFDEVIELINQTFRAGSDQDIRTDYPLVFDRSKLECMRVVKADGRIVAQVPVAPRETIAGADAFTIGIISPTITHPEHRHRGYATLCLRDCIRLMEERDWVASVLWTVEATFPFYRNSGFEAVGCQGFAFRLDGEDVDRFDRGAFDVIPFDAGNEHHLGAAIRLHDGEPFRIARTAAEYRALYSLPKTQTWLACQGGEITASLTLGEGTNKPGLIEGGGSCPGLEALVAYVLAQRPGQQTQAIVPLTPCAMGQLLQDRKPESRIPVEEAAGVGFQMMRINSLMGLLRRLESYLRERSTGLATNACLLCSDSGEAVTIHARDGEIELAATESADPVVLTRRQLVQLIFGSHASLPPPAIDGPGTELLQALFPYYFPIWELDHS